MNKIKMMKHNLLIFLILIFISCGESFTGGDHNQQAPDETILTDKLIGTPFEGMTIGDDVPWCQFLQTPYLTSTVTEADLPIPVFLVFFTASEEEIIKEGIGIANQGIGYELFVVTDTWCDHCRVILKVDYIYDEVAADLGNPMSNYGNVLGHTINQYYSFENTFSSNVVSDWTIEIRSDAIQTLGEKIIAHELGHAMGIQFHRLIDYEYDDVLDLETNSLMSATMPSEPTYTDYNFMMSKQFEILQTHYGLTEENPGGVCP